MEYIKKNKKLYQQAFALIKKYQTIVIYRHEMPDFDASGSQNGLATWLKDSFPTKKIYTMGNDFIDFTPTLFPHIDEVDVSTLGEFLTIVVDTGNTARIDNKTFSQGKEIIKFDHHPAVENYGNINIVNDELASCAELIVDFIYFTGKRYPLSMLAAKYLFTGIVGDSGRFLFSSTSMHTFDMASYCMKTGFDINKDVYLKMYEKDIFTLEVQKYILNNYKLSENGVAYYVLNQNELDKLHLRVEQAKNQISLFSNIKGIGIWVSVAEDTASNVYRVSIRSKNVAINEVASHFNGGGHAQASGAKLMNIDELPLLISELDNLLK